MHLSGTLAQCIQEKYSRLILQSKELVSQGNVEEALKCNQTAYKLCPSEKLQRKIQRMQVSIHCQGLMASSLCSEYISCYEI